MLVAGFGVSAQSFSTVSGSIVDPFTRALPSVTLTLSNPQNQSKYEIKSDSTGHYEFVGVPPGNYVLTAEYMGFAAVKREGVVLAGQPFQQNITMQVGIAPGNDHRDRWTASSRPRRSTSCRDRAAKRQARPVACTGTPVGGNIRPPTKIRDVRPVYPTGVPPGQVELERAASASTGFVDERAAWPATPILRSPMRRSTAVSQWEFTPTLLDCQPIEVRMKVHVNFVAAK